MAFYNTITNVLKIQFVLIIELLSFAFWTNLDNNWKVNL